MSSAEGSHRLGGRLGEADHHAAPEARRRLVGCVGVGRAGRPAVAGDPVVFEMGADGVQQVDAAHRLRPGGAVVLDPVLPQRHVLGAAEGHAAIGRHRPQALREGAEPQAQAVVHVVAFEGQPPDHDHLAVRLVDGAVAVQVPAHRLEEVGHRHAVGSHAADLVAGDRHVLEIALRDPDLVVVRRVRPPDQVRRRLEGLIRREAHAGVHPLQVVGRRLPGEGLLGEDRHDADRVVVLALDEAHAPQGDAVAVAAAQAVLADLHPLGAAADLHAAGTQGVREASGRPLDPVALDEQVAARQVDRRPGDRRGVAEEEGGEGDPAVAERHAPDPHPPHRTLRRHRQQQVVQEHAVQGGAGTTGQLHAHLSAAVDLQVAQGDVAASFDAHRRALSARAGAHQPRVAAAAVDVDVLPSGDHHRAGVGPRPDADLAAGIRQRVDRRLDAREAVRSDGHRAAAAVAASARLRQDAEGVAAVGGGAVDPLLAVVLHQGEAQVVVLDPLRRQGQGRAAGVPGPLDVPSPLADEGPRRHPPEIAGAVGAGLEADLDAALQPQEAAVRRRRLDRQRAVGRVGQVPAPHLRVDREVGQGEGRAPRIDLQVLVVHHLEQAHQHPGLAPQLPAVVGQLDPAGVVEGEGPVPPDAPHAQHVTVEAEPVSDHGAVVPGPLEGRFRTAGGLAVVAPFRKGAAVVDLDPVELVLQPDVAAARRHHAGVVRVGVGTGPGPQAAGGRGDEVVPLRQVVVAGEPARDPVPVVVHLAFPEGEELDLADGAHPGRGVRPAQGALPDLRVLQGGDVAPPDVEVDEVRAGFGVEDLPARREWQVVLGVDGGPAPDAPAVPRIGHVPVELQGPPATGDCRDPGHLPPVGVVHPGGAHLDPVPRRQLLRLHLAGRQGQLVRRRGVLHRQVPAGTELAQDAVDPEPATSDQQVAGATSSWTGGRHLDPEAAAVRRHRAGAEDVPERGLPQVILDRPLLVPVGVDLYPPLLHEDAGVALPAVPGRSCEVAFHGGAPMRS